MKTGKRQNVPGTKPSGVDWTEVNRILDYMSERGLDEFEYEKGDLRIRLRRSGGLGLPVPGATRSSGAQVAPSSSAGKTPAGVTVGVGPTPPAATEQLHTIKSPIVGTFYSAASPTAAPFVKVGDRVSVGQVLCIIEAMKLMNEIESDIAGEVMGILVENARPVEYGEPLFTIRPATQK